MRLGLLLFVIAIGAGTVGYQEIRHGTERETWRDNLAELESRLETAERLAESRAKTLAEFERYRTDKQKAAARLAELEEKILDAAAEITRLESDRAVAEDRAASAMRDLKKQVRALTTIEIDMATLGEQREHLEHHVETIEHRLQEAEIGAAERQKRAEELDRNIAGLAIRREALLASLMAAEHKKPEAAPSEAVEIAKGEAEPSVPVAALEAPPSSSAASTLPDAEGGGVNRTRGLYQFSSLSADPEAASADLNAGGQGGLPPPSARGGNSADAASTSENWAEDQYLLGLSLISRAELSSSTRELSEAILAFKAVLVEWPKERDPMRWATVQSDLCYAMALSGARRGDVSLLTKAEQACRDALSEFRRDEAPLLWAAAQHHLGVSLSGLAEMHEDQDMRLKSIEALTLAVDAFDSAGAADDAKKVQTRLSKVYADLARASEQ